MKNTITRIIFPNRFLFSVIFFRNMQQVFPNIMDSFVHDRETKNGIGEKNPVSIV